MTWAQAFDANASGMAVTVIVSVALLAWGIKR